MVLKRRQGATEVVVVENGALKAGRQRGDGSMKAVFSKCQQLNGREGDAQGPSNEPK